jgi:hypothetical protein
MNLNSFPLARLTRLTNAFSRKIGNHMAAGVTDRLWDVEDLVAARATNVALSEGSERRAERRAA